MQSTFTTERLCLTRLTAAPRASREFTWLHELFSDERAALWSLAGPSKTPADTEKAISRNLGDDAETARDHVVYAVHERPVAAASSTETSTSTSTPAPFIGLVVIKPVTTAGLPLAPPYVPAASPTTLVVELAYMFLPVAWGRGLGTEAVRAAVGAAAAGAAAGVVWEAWERVWVRVIVNERNRPSGRVMHKVGLTSMGMYTWEGERMWIGGEWVVKEDLLIFGGELK